MGANNNSCGAPQPFTSFFVRIERIDSYVAETRDFKGIKEIGRAATAWLLLPSYFRLNNA